MNDFFPPPQMFPSYYLQMIDGPCAGKPIFQDRERLVDVWRPNIFEPHYHYVDDSEIGLRFWYHEGMNCRLADDGIPLYTLYYVRISNLNEGIPGIEDNLQKERISRRKSWLSRIRNAINQFFTR